jgi:capsular exopolysaccharide synthesis family protein
MSRIFDALQRLEAETAGTDLSALSAATELLEAAERKVREAAGQHGAGEWAEAGDGEAWAAGTRPAITLPEMAPAHEGVEEEELEHCPELTAHIPGENRLVATGKQESLGAEKFRFLAVRLRQIRQTRPLKKILVTSTIPQEGKSTVAANLALTLARRKPHKTLLLDGDLRRPTGAAQFGLGKVPGLCEWLSGETAGINVYRLQNLGLWILPAGVAPENPLELMQSGKLAPLIDRLTGWFDWIVIDSPPVLPLADTSIWSRLADGILLVTRKATTEKQQLQRGLSALDQSKLLGALVNSSVNVAHSDYYQRYGAAALERSQRGKASAGRVRLGPLQPELEPRIERQTIERETVEGKTGKRQTVGR